jgi:hypothetical protein
VRTHLLLEELAIQRQETLSARVRANRPNATDALTGGADPRTDTARHRGSLARMVALVGRA